ncbi:MAG: dockerin type I repeat-containing protein [Clostridia bacterium]|nr:dockerin type I repeat-containing protein [Clostridia bacterium]
MKKVFSAVFAFTSVLLVVLLAATPLFSAFAAEDHNVMLAAEDQNVMLNATETGVSERQHVVLYDQNFEPVDDTKIKSPVRSEVGKSKVVAELPDREGSGVQVQMIYDRVMIGIQPKGIGDILYPYGEFKDGDTFHFKMDVYLDVDNPQDFYPFVLLCIGGGARSPEEKEYNYDEWYPSEKNGQAKNLTGSNIIQPRTWTTVEYEFTVKDGASDKGRNISFYTDAGAFYLYFGSQVLNKNIYLDNILLEMDTAADPNTRTMPTTAPKTTIKEPTTAPKTNPTVTAGDVNNDGAVNMKDVLILRKHLAGIEVEMNANAADMNADGAVNMKDVLALRKKLAGL